MVPEIVEPEMLLVFIWSTRTPPSIVLPDVKLRLTPLNAPPVIELPPISDVPPLNVRDPAPLILPPLIEVPETVLAPETLNAPVTATVLPSEIVPAEPPVTVVPLVVFAE